MKKKFTLNKARVAGYLILLIAVLAPFSMMYVPSALVVSGDATATANNIAASEGLFRAGIAIDAIVFMLEVVLVSVLYELFKTVNKTLSLIAAFARLAMTIVQGINLINCLFPLLLLSNSSYLAVFASDQLHALVMLFLNAHESMSLIWGLLFSLHLFVLGYLIFKSGCIPKFVGALLVLASLCYLIQGFGNILLPKYEEIYTIIGFLSIVELVFPVWLVIKGVRKSEMQSIESA